MVEYGDEFLNALLGSVRVSSDVDRQAVEAFAGLVGQVSEARRVLAEDGVFVLDERGRLVESPAARSLRAASAEIRGWMKDRPDLFGAGKPVRSERRRFKGLEAV